MTTWPLTLPQFFSTDGYNDTLPDNTLRTSMDVGPPKIRRRTVSNVRKISGNMVVTFAQWAILQDFFQNTISETLPFDFPDPEDSDDTLEVVFASPPQKQFYAAGKYRAAISFEVQP